MEEEKAGSRIFLIERRREERRTQVHVSVEVTIDRGDGPPSRERTFIEDVSDFGCRFTTHMEVRQDDTVSLKVVTPAGKRIQDEEARLYKIMWVAPKGRRFTAGARLIKGEKLMDPEPGPAAAAPEQHSK